MFLLEIWKLTMRCRKSWQLWSVSSRDRNPCEASSVDPVVRVDRYRILSK